MCGLVAICAPESQIDPLLLQNAVKALHHRGPDGNGSWISPDGKVALGHTRLAIIGLDDGGQPIANEDEQIHIVVNGELYDFERIRDDLRRRGHKFRTGSDSEIAIHLYEEYGLNFLQHLRGEFVLVLWDERRKLLLAARDRFGIKPLCYSLHKGKLLLASEAKALFAAGVPPVWDMESFYHAANMQYVLPHRTLFEGVNQLQPGHYLVFQDGKMQSAAYWDLDYATEQSQLQFARDADAIAEFRDKLSESVRLRLRADIPVCCHLSGGLDSSAILALAREHTSEPIKCFTVSFEEESYDEFEAAQEMAGAAGGDFHPLRIKQADLLEHLSDAVYFSEGLAVNGHLPAKYLLNREIRRAGYKVALTGEGSDEVVAGYPHLRSDLFRFEGRGELLDSLHSTNKASQGIMLKHGQSLPLSAVQEKLQYVPGFLEAKGTLGFKVNSILDPQFRSQFEHRDCYADLMECFDIQSQLHGRNRVDQSLYLWSKTALANYILKTLGDGCEMAHAVEGRLPFLDHHLFEYVRRLPLRLKIKDTVEKFILREAVRGKITDKIYRRQKHPFVAPPLSCFQNGAQDLLQDTLRSKQFSDLPFFDGKKMRQLLDSLGTMNADERAANDPVLMTALSAASLQARLKLQAGTGKECS